MTGDLWMTAADVAERLQITPGAVYASPELRAVARRLGTGPKARLRWTAADLERAFPASCDDGRRVEPAGSSAGAVLDDPRPPSARRRRRRLPEAGS